MVTPLLADLPGDAADQAGQAGAGAVGQAEIRDRRLDRRRGDIDDPAEPTPAHPVDHRADQGDRGQHVGAQGCQPDVLAPVAEIAGRRAAGIVHQDVRIGAGGEQGGAAFLGGDVGGHR